MRTSPGKWERESQENAAEGSGREFAGDGGGRAPRWNIAEKRGKAAADNVPSVSPQRSRGKWR